MARLPLLMPLPLLALVLSALAHPRAPVPTPPPRAGHTELVHVWGHYDLFVPGTVASLLYSPDGKQLLARESTRAVRSWELAAGEQLGHWPADSLCLLPSGVLTGGAACEAHACRIERVSALFPDGQRLLSATDRTLDLCDLTGQREPQTLALPAQASSPTAVAVLPDGSAIIVGDDSGALHALALAGKAPTSTLAVHAQRVVALRVLSDGKTLESLGADGRVQRLPTTLAGKGAGFSVVKTARGAVDCNAESVEAGAFSPDGMLVLVASRRGGSDLACTASDGRVRLWDVKRQSVRWEIPGTLVHAATFSPNGREVALAAAVHPEDRADPRPMRVVRVDVATGKTLDPDAGAPITRVHFAPDGVHAVAGDAGGSLHLFDVASGRTLTSAVLGGGSVEGFAFSPDGASLLVETEDDRGRLYQASDLKAVRTVVAAPRESETRRRSDGSRCEYDAQAKQALEQMQLRPAREGKANGSVLAPLPLRDPQDFGVGSEGVEEVAFPGPREALLPYAEESCVAFGSGCSGCQRTYSLARVNLSTGHTVRRYEDVDEELLGTCSVRPDIFLTRREGGGVDVRAVEQGHILTTFGVRFGEVKSCDATPSGTRVLAATATHLALYDGRTFRLLESARRPGARGGSVALSPDGTLAVELSGSQVRLLRFPGAEELERLPLELYDDTPTAVDFAPDGQSFAVGTARGVVLHFALHPRSARQGP